MRVKRLFTTISLLALVNLGGLAGLAGYAWSKGWIEQDRVRRAIAALKGEQEEPALATGKARGSEPKSAGQAIERIRRNEESEEQHRIELVLREQEIKKGWELLASRDLALLREKEALEEEKRRFVAERERLAETDGSSGLKKELEVLSGVNPKTAKDLLKLKDDADVVRILMSMDQRKVSNIVKQCKTNEERLWIGRVMEQFHDGNATQAEDLGAG